MILFLGIFLKMIIFLIFLYSFFPSEAFTQSSPGTGTAVSTSLTISSCVALKDEIACKALGSHGCEWSKYVQHCFNATAVKHCHDLHGDACDKDELCDELSEYLITCADKQSAYFLQEICIKGQLSKEKCENNALCEYFTNSNVGCLPQENIFYTGIECYGLREEECFLNKKCIFFEVSDSEWQCKDYRDFPPTMCRLIYHSDKKVCNEDEHCFWSENHDNCFSDFECGKITDEGRCNYYPDHCRWEWNACNLVNDRFCGQFNEHSCQSKHCKWYNEVKACLSPNTPIPSNDCRLIHPTECAKNKKCILIQSKKRCQGYAFTAQANMQKPYCFRGKPNCKCLMDDEKWGYICVNKDWIKGTSYKGNKIGHDDQILFDNEGNCFKNISSGNYEEYNSAVEIQKPIFDCFKNFHDAALLPICGHPHFDTLAYCWRAYHYGNVDFEKFMKKNDEEKGQYMLILLDGCFFCNQKRDYFAANLEVQIEVMKSEAKPIMQINERLLITPVPGIKKVNSGYVSIIDGEGNFMVALRINIDDYLFAETNLILSIRHRCSDQMKLNFKNMVLRLEYPKYYPTRVILANKVAIGLDNTSGNYSEEIAFNQLPGKADQ